MQLSTSVCLPESLPSPAVPPNPGGPTGSGPAAGAFAALLPGAALDLPAAKKPAGASDPAQEAAAATWVAWFAATPPPAQPLPVGNLEITGDAARVGATGTPVAPGSAVTQGPAATSTTAADPVARHAPIPGGLLRISPPPVPPAPGASTPVSFPVIPSAADGSAATAPQVPSAAPAAGATGPASLPAASVDSQALVSAQVAVAPALPADASPAPAARASGANPVADGKRVKLPGGGMEKIAAQPGKSVAAVQEEAGGGDKKILSIDDEELVKPDSSLGTDNASRPPMPNPAQPAHSLSSGSAGGAPVALLQPAPVASPAGASAEPALLAHRAVEAVMTATERIDTGNRSVVRLQFSVGDASLSVQVELRAGEVHTTFRTDSSELRAALATEWQAVNGDSTRAVRLADPVFAPATPHGPSAGFSDGGAQQRNAARDQAQDAPSFGFAAAPAAAASRPAAARLPAAAPLPGSANLHAFA